MKHGTLFKDETGNWRMKPEVVNDNFTFSASVVKYMNEMDPLFLEAKEKSDLQFILTLMRFKGAFDPGWDPLENLKQVFEAFQSINDLKLGTTITLHCALFMYGLILEASVPYNLLANLLNVIEGGEYNIDNFHDETDSHGRTRAQSPKMKIDQIKSRAKKQRIKLSLFDEFFDNNLRNAIFHSDYSYYDNQIRIFRPIRNYSYEEWMTILNKALAYLEAFFNLYKVYIASYEKPELIDVPENFIHHPNEKITTIVRKGHGLLGIKDRWTEDEIARGYIPFRLVNCHQYEIELIEKGTLFLPPDQIKKFNKKIKYLPSFIKKHLVKKFRVKYKI